MSAIHVIYRAGLGIGFTWFLVFLFGGRPYVLATGLGLTALGVADSLAGALRVPDSQRRRLAPLGSLAWSLVVVSVALVEIALSGRGELVVLLWIGVMGLFGAISVIGLRQETRDRARARE